MLFYCFWLDTRTVLSNPRSFSAIWCLPMVKIFIWLLLSDTETVSTIFMHLNIIAILYILAEQPNCLIFYPKMIFHDLRCIVVSLRATYILNNWSEVAKEYRLVICTYIYYLLGGEGERKASVLWCILVLVFCMFLRTRFCGLRAIDKLVMACSSQINLILQTVYLPLILIFWMIILVWPLAPRISININRYESGACCNDPWMS